MRWQVELTVCFSVMKVMSISRQRQLRINLTPLKVYFYLLDTIPLFLASSVYAIIWPGRWFEELEDRAASKPKHNVQLQNWSHYNNYGYNHA